MKKVLLILFCLLKLNCFSQEIIKSILGTVIDENDNPLINVWVTMPGVETRIKCFTDDFGKFELELINPVTLGTSNIITLKFELEGYYYKPKNACIINPKTSVLNADIILVKKPINTLMITVKDNFTMENVENCKVKYNDKIQMTDEFGNVFLTTNPDDNEFVERKVQVIKKDSYWDFDTTFTLSLLRSKGNYITILLKRKDGAVKPTLKRKCEIENTGNFCFVNNTQYSLNVRIYFTDNRQAMYSPGDAQDVGIEPGDSGFIYNIKAKSYSIYCMYSETPGYFFKSSEGMINVSPCITNRKYFGKR